MEVISLHGTFNIETGHHSFSSQLLFLESYTFYIIFYNFYNSYISYSPVAIHHIVLGPSSPHYP